MVPRKSSRSDANANVLEELPSATKKELLYENYYYDVTEWIKRHPGGRVIEYYTQSGEDATIAIKQFHQRSTQRVMSIMNTLKRRPASESSSESETPSSPRHKALTEDFLKLYQELLDEGMFTPSIKHVAVRILEVATFLIVGFYFLNAQSLFLRFLAVFCITMYFGRSGWIQHEGGHHSLTGNPKTDKFIQQLVFGIGNGMAGSWWIAQHNRHHAMPQRLQRDVDLDTLPLVAFSTKVAKGPKDGKNLFVKYQAFLFLAIDTFIVAVLWKFYLHPRYVYRKRLYVEMVFMTIHYIIPYYMGLPYYLLNMWLASIYLFGNFALSHTHLPVTNDSLHWVEYSLLHTTNINPSLWCDWWMGYLNYQIEHHLFPTMPQFRQPLIVPRVRALAKKHNIPYKCMSYYEALVHSFSNLNEVSKELNGNSSAGERSNDFEAVSWKHKSKLK